MKNILPKHLIDEVNEGNVVLFLGSGASDGAIHPNKKKIPLGQELADLIAEKFLSEKYKNMDLQYVSELAENEAGQFTVQEFIVKLFDEFNPGEHHKLIPNFVWRAIYTTNFDLIVERAYDSSNSPLQELVIFIKNGESIDKKITSRNQIVYSKLHGCITEIRNSKLPLILTPDQYVTHKQNRSRLYERMIELAYEYTFVFVGFSFADLDIRSTLNHLNLLSKERPRSYMVGPAITREEEKLWENKKIGSIVLNFKDFLNMLNQNIDHRFKILSTMKTDKHEYPIFKKFKTSIQEKRPTKSLIDFLEYEVDYLHSNFPTKDSDPKKFYKGYFHGWDPILKNFDVKRKITDDILSEVFLIDEDERASKQDFYLIKGHAGSGKTVLFKRIAWEAANEFGKICLYSKPEIGIRYEPLYELHHYCRERIFLFIDKPSDNIEDILNIIKKSRKDQILLTIICAERINVWNIECEQLESYLIQDYILEFLTNKEILSLISLLEKYGSLGYLRDKNEEERIKALTEKAGRRLLVALHEATLGKAFEDIIYDEYKSIKNDEAKSLYLTICILHRLGTHVRAGLISRVHKIGFSYFEKYLFDPLESIVFDKFFPKINDYVYLSRHQHIAEMVFERVLIDKQKRHDEYIRIISHLDIDYKSDRLAFISMTNAKNLLDIFKEDPNIIRDIYRVAKQRIPDNPQLKQQEAIFEMKLKVGGNIKKAEELLKQAHSENPSNVQITHSFAELLLIKAENASNRIEKDKHLKTVKQNCLKIINNNPHHIYSYHTLLKAYLLKLKDVIQDDTDSLIDVKIKELEELLNKVLQTFPKDPFILELESQFNELLDKEPKALEALKKAFDANKHTPYISLRLSNFYEKRNEIEQARKIIEETLQLNPTNKDINFKYSKLKSKEKDPDYADIKHYLRKSFTEGDNRYNAQFLYARCLYILGEYSESNEIFNRLSNTNIDERTKRQPSWIYYKNNKPEVYKGSISKIEVSYGFLKRDGIGDNIYFYKYHDHNIKWEDLKRNKRVIFNLAFNYRGTIALNIRKEGS